MICGARKLIFSLREHKHTYMQWQTNFCIVIIMIFQACLCLFLSSFLIRAVTIRLLLLLVFVLGTLQYSTARQFTMIDYYSTLRVYVSVLIWIFCNKKNVVVAIYAYHLIAFYSNNNNNNNVTMLNVSI